MRLPIRVRLTIWYSSVLILVLLTFSAGVAWLHGHYSRMQFDTELASVATAAGRVLGGELDAGHDLARAASETRNAVDIPNRTLAILNQDGDPLAAHWRGFRRDQLPPTRGPWPMTTTVLQNGE